MSGYNTELESIVRELNKSPKPATDGPGDAPTPAGPPQLEPSASLSSLDQLLAYATRHGASDIILVAGSGLVLRVNGGLTQPSGRPFSDDDIRSLMLPLLTAQRRKELERERSTDFSFVRDGIGRFRTNIHFQRGTLGAAIRLLPDQIPTLEQLNLPSSLGRLTERKQGLVLVTGPTGSGKTTTLAALIAMINAKYPYHLNYALRGAPEEG